MKKTLLLILTPGLAFSLRAQTPDATYSPEVASYWSALEQRAAQQSPTPGAAYTPEQLDQLLGPIALYPDPLIALILPAATVPPDLALAASYLAANGSPAGIDAQPWDPSVKGLARYPDVVKWMNDNLPWTQTLGAAFAQQPADVMKSIQQLRAQAIAAGTLFNTPQQQVDLDGDDIRIVPTLTDTLYVPQYDPNLAYEVSPSDAGPFITFGGGFPVGAWLGYECNWDDFNIWVGPWVPGWVYRRDWRQPDHGGNASREWKPDPRHARAVVRNYYRPEVPPPHPAVIGGYHGPVREPGRNIAPSSVPVYTSPDYRGRVATPSVFAPPPALSVNQSRGAPPSVFAPPPHEPVSRPQVVVPPPTYHPAPSSSLFGGYSRGTQTRDFSTRGQTSRAAPVRTPPPAAASSQREPAPNFGSGKDKH